MATFHLSEAIREHQRAVQLTQVGMHPSLPYSLEVWLFCRFKRTGDMEDISEAIKQQRHAVQLTEGHTDLQARLNNHWPLPGRLSQRRSQISVAPLHYHWS
jgi:hypothetical protein